MFIESPPEPVQVEVSPPIVQITEEAKPLHEEPKPSQMQTTTTLPPEEVKIEEINIEEEPITEPQTPPPPKVKFVVIPPPPPILPAQTATEEVEQQVLALVSKRKWEEVEELVQQAADNGTPVSKETYMHLFAKFKKR